MQRLFEAQVSYVGLEPFRISAGIFKPNYSLESMQGAGDYLFLERASIVTATRNLGAGIRREGVQVQADGDRYIASAALTAGQAGPGRDGNQRAVVARVAGLPVRDPDLTVHVGVSGQYVFRPAREPGAPRLASLSEQTEIRIDDVGSSVSTPDIEASSIGVIGPELGITWRRLLVRGSTTPCRSTAAPRTAAARPPSTAGTRRPPTPCWAGRGSGSTPAAPGERPSPTPPSMRGRGSSARWSLGARFSTIDLNDRNVCGGRQNVVSAVVNWWPIEPVRLSLVYEHADVSGGPSPRDLDAVGGRVQLQF